jgi:glycerol uptake facilitator-like aquaporin
VKGSEADAPTRCFFERDSSLPLYSRALAEALGTSFLTCVAGGASLGAEHLFGRHSPAVLLVSAIAPASALAALVLTFGLVSGGHFNPLITILQWLGRERRLDCTVAYVLAQLAGALAGIGLIKLIYGPIAVAPSPPALAWNLLWSEGAATASLMIVVFGCARGGHAETGGFAVGVWLAAAILATPSRSYANPALTIGAAFAQGPLGMQASSAGAFICAQVIGALLAFALIGICFPNSHRERESSMNRRVGARSIK